jgi:hypothetical protein
MDPFEPCFSADQSTIHRMTKREKLHASEGLLSEVQKKRGFPNDGRVEFGPFSRDPTCAVCDLRDRQYRRFGYGNGQMPGAGCRRLATVNASLVWFTMSFHLLPSLFHEHAPRCVCAWSRSPMTLVHKFLGTSRIEVECCRYDCTFTAPTFE